MTRRICVRGVTRAEVVVTLMVAAMAAAMVLPAISAQREAQKRSQCQRNLQLLGLGLDNYHSTMKRLPPAAAVVVDKQRRQEVDGWSFLVHVLPYAFGKEASIYETLKLDAGPDAEPPGKGAPHKKARDTVVSDYICPDSPSKRYEMPDTRENALTSYKAMGATTLASLNVCLTNPADPINPDGAMYPGSLTTYGRMNDGMCHTILCAETIDAKASVWTRGTDVTMYGLPDAVKIEKPDATFPYARPVGYTGRMGKNAPATLKGATVMAFDKPGKYVAFPSAVKMDYGPSSAHPGIVNHLFADGTAHSLAKSIDAAAYMFLITRAGRDPFPADEVE
jgi:type II secretory pathway pseudopilin PulG